MLRVIKDVLPHTLLGRSLLILVLPIFIVQAFTVFIFLDRHWDTMTERLADALSGEIAIIVDQYNENPNAHNAGVIRNYAAEHLDLDVMFEADAVLPVDQSKYLGWGQFVYQSFSNALGEALTEPFVVEISMQEKWALVHIQSDHGVISIWCPIRRLFSSSGYIFLLWMMGSSILMLAIAVLFMRNQIRPIRRLAIAAGRFGRGQDVPSLKPSGAREVREATKAFLKMKARIERHLQQRTSMLAGVSHDLRTPLTRMKIQLSMMQDQPDAHDLLQDVKDMERMINAYLDFVRGDGDEAVELVKIDEFMQRIVENAKRSNIVVQESINTDAGLKIRPVAMERCLMNIISNAAQYGGNVWLSADLNAESKLNINVSDDGPGLAPELHEDVFKPFYRVEKSRNKKTGGNGLGLSIAQNIVHAHGGTISLSKSKHGGLSVTVLLPLT